MTFLWAKQIPSHRNTPRSFFGTLLDFFLFIFILPLYAATQQFNLKGNIMIGYTEIEKKYKEFEAQVKQINEFWVNAVISSLKQFVK